MSDWSELRLRDLFASSSPGDWGTEGSPESGVSVLRSTNFRNDGSIDYSDIAYRSIDERRLKQRCVNAGTVLIEKSGGSPTQAAGRVVYCEGDFNGTASNFIEIMKVKPDFDPKYVAYVLYYLYQIGLVLKYQQQTTGIINFKLNEYLEEWVKCTSFKPEQTKIAEILSMVDRAIEQTGALIGKQQRIKTGLMKDLLIRGIDEHGNLRSESTHKFKDSPIGRIPAEWEVWNLSQVLLSPPRNGIYKPASKIGSGTLLIGQTSFTQERRIDYRLARRAEVSTAEAKSYGLCDGDILVTRVFATVQGVGRPTLVSALPEPSVYESNMLRLQVDHKYMRSALLFYWLESFQTRRRVESSVNASNQTSINQTVLNALPVPVTSPNEQEEIQRVLLDQESQIHKAKALRDKLQRLKSAMMQDLLTGKKRVTPLLELEPTNS